MAAKRRQRIPTLVKIFLFCFALYAAIALVRLQFLISEKTARIAEVDAMIDTRISENAALRENVERGVSDDEIAALARDKLGYAFPQERVFIDASSK